MAAPSYGNRPQGREICKKVNDALHAIQAGRRQLGVYKHLFSDLEALDVNSEEECG